MADTALADGTYQLVNAANTALALDDAGNSYANVSNVRLWTRNTSNAQIVRIWTRSDGSRQLAFAGSGKAVDVTNADFSHGANVAIYDCNDTDAQKWTIAAVSGKTATVDSTSYQLWKVYCTKTYTSATKLLLEASGTGTPSSGTNLVISEDESTSTDQMWAFVPLNPVPDGCYVLRSVYTQDLVADVEGSSHSCGARVCVSSYHVGTGPDYGNNQIVRVKTDAKTGRSKLYFMHSGLLMEIADTVNVASSGSHVVQSNDEGTSTDQMWVIVPDGYGQLNGVNVPAYCIHNDAVDAAGNGTTYCLDITDGHAWAGTYLQLCVQNYSDAQRWMLDPAQYTTQGMQAPSVLGVAMGSTSEEYATVHTVNAETASSSSAWRACWKGTAAAYQVRYRYRMRYAPSGVWEIWHAWQSCGDNSYANSGWGYVGTATSATKAGGIWYSPSIATDACDGSQFDSCQIEVEVRAFDGADTPRNSPSVSATSTCIYIPAGTCSKALLDYEGLHVTWSFDQWPAGIWTAQLSSIMDGDTELLAEPVQLSGKSGSWCIPYTGLCDIPASGDSLDVTFALTSSTVAGSNVSTVSATYAEKATIAPSASFGATDRLTVAVTMARHALDGVYTIPGAGKPMLRQDIVQDGTTGVWDVEAPIGRASVLIVCHESDDTWCAAKKSTVGILPPAYVWTWTDSRQRKRAAILYAGLGGNPKETDSKSTDATAYAAIGAELPVYRAPKAMKHSLDVSAVTITDAGANRGRYALCSKWSTPDAFDELLVQRRAIYRDPAGGVYKVFVSGRELPYETSRHREVSVTQYEEGR